MGRPSQSQPGHRRPSWAKKDSTYKTYISNATIRRRIPGDYGLDNFSYDESHLSEWQMPRGLAKHLPQQLREAATDWVYAGAAVCTALERIEGMNNEAIKRTNPAVTHTHLLGRRPSDQTPTVVGAANTSAPDSPSTTSSSSTPPARRLPLTNPVPQLPVNMTGLESPPFTPIDSKVPNTPFSEPLIGPNGTAPDLDSVTAQLCPLSFSSGNKFTISPRPTVKNDKAWEYFIGAFNEELVDLKRNALQRLKGYGRTIDTTCMELTWDRSLAREHKAALERFVLWWKVMKGKVGVYQDKVAGMEAKMAATKERRELVAA